MNKIELAKKWSAKEGKIGIASIEDNYMKENMAQLLENQESVDAKTLNEDSTFSQNAPSSTATGQFQPISLALVRRTFPDLFANKVVPVQALTGPVGLAYALRFVYKGYEDVEAGFQNVNIFSGFTGSTSGASGAADSGTGILPISAGEALQLNPGNGTMPELKLKLERKAIEATTRKLAASWSLEASQDIGAMHGIDMEREMVNVLQYEVLAELDRELVSKLRAVAEDVTKGGEVVPTVSVSGSDGRWSQEKFAVITNTIIAKANDIAKYTRRGAGNFAIVSPDVATALQASGAVFTKNESNINATGTMVNVGTLNGTITVYRDSYATDSYALVGYKGPGVSDGGVIYSPYIMGLQSRAIAEEDFSPRIGVMSRYAITDSLLGAGRYYRLIKYSDLSSVIGV